VTSCKTAPAVRPPSSRSHPTRRSSAGSHQGLFRALRHPRPPGPPRPARGAVTPHPAVPFRGPPSTTSPMPWPYGGPAAHPPTGNPPRRETQPTGNPPDGNPPDGKPPDGKPPDGKPSRREPRRREQWPTGTQPTGTLPTGTQADGKHSRREHSRREHSRRSRSGAGRSPAAAGLARSPTRQGSRTNPASSTNHRDADRVPRSTAGRPGATVILSMFGAYAAGLPNREWCYCPRPAGTVKLNRVRTGPQL